MIFLCPIEKLNAGRRLTAQERADQLKQKQRLDIEPHYQLCVIKLNSTYLESVDRWFGNKGLISAVTLIVIVGCITFYCAMLHVTLGGSARNANDDFVVLIFIALMMSPLLACAVWLLRKESFSYTHYPMRFNRKTGMVHVFRTNGTVLSVPWNKVFFTLGRVDQVQNLWGVYGHVLAHDQITIVESFSLSICEIGTPDGLLLIRSHWEFIRRYMEEGPAEVSDQVQFCLPISERRESFGIALHRLMANNSVQPTIGLPLWLASVVFDLLTVPFRFFAVRTSKVPFWPQEIDNECAIERDDPYAIRGAEDGDRLAVFPEAARAAGVSFKGPPHVRYKSSPEGRNG